MLSYILGLTHMDVIVNALVEIIHAFTVTDPDFIGLATKLYLSLLMAEVRLDHSFM